MFRVERLENHQAEDQPFLAQLLDGAARNGWLFVQLVPLPYSNGYSIIFRRV